MIGRFAYYFWFCEKFCVADFLSEKCLAMMRMREMIKNKIDIKKEIESFVMGKSELLYCGTKITINTVRGNHQ